MMTLADSLRGALLGLALATLAWAAGAPAGGLVLGVVAGATLPVLLARERAQARQRELRRALPFHLDLLTLAVEAGLELGPALQAVLERGRPGPLLEELRVASAALRVGRTRAEALGELSARLALPELTAVVTAVLQAERLGVGLARALRLQSTRFRTERFQQAEARAGQAPVKLLVPLALLIFPTSFLVLAAPLVLAHLVGR